VAHTVFDFPNFFLIRVGRGPTHPLPNFSRNFGIFLFSQDPLATGVSHVLNTIMYAIRSQETRLNVDGFSINVTLVHLKAKLKIQSNHSVTIFC